jgi:hypothetical protein
MELLNDMFLFPYYTFNYIFSLAIWVMLTIFIMNWLRDQGASDMFQYKFNRIMDNLHDRWLGVKETFKFSKRSK